jgi:hypothetical protein
MLPRSAGLRVMNGGNARQPLESRHSIYKY